MARRIRSRPEWSRPGKTRKQTKTAKTAKLTKIRARPLRCFRPESRKSEDSGRNEPEVSRDGTEMADNALS